MEKRERLGPLLDNIYKGGREEEPTPSRSTDKDRPELDYNREAIKLAGAARIKKCEGPCSTLLFPCRKL